MSAHTHSYIHTSTRLQSTEEFIMQAKGEHWEDVGRPDVPTPMLPVSHESDRRSAQRGAQDRWIED